MRVKYVEFQGTGRRLSFVGCPTMSVLLEHWVLLYQSSFTSPQPLAFDSFALKLACKEIRTEGGYELFLCQPEILRTVNSGMILISGHETGHWVIVQAESFVSPGKGTDIYEVTTLS